MLCTELLIFKREILQPGVQFRQFQILALNTTNLGPFFVLLKKKQKLIIIPPSSQENKCVCVTHKIAENHHSCNLLGSDISAFLAAIMQTKQVNIL